MLPEQTQREPTLGFIQLPLLFLCFNVHVCRKTIFNILLDQLSLEEPRILDESMILLEFST